MCNEIKTDIIEYLIQKLESREKNLSKYTNTFIAINSFEEFYQKRKDIINLFKNLEDDLHQTILALKYMMVQNKALSQENIDNKLNQKNYDKLLQENNYLLIENNKYAQKIKELNNKNKNPKFTKRAKSPTFNGIYKTISYDNNSNKNKNKPLKNNISGNKITKINNINNLKKNNNIKRPYRIEDIYNYNLELNDLDKLKNIKNIMNEINTNKNKLKEVIDEHFEKNKTQGNRINNYLQY